jgi:hypothetical protein
MGTFSRRSAKIRRRPLVDLPSAPPTERQDAAPRLATFAVISLWMLASMVVAVRQALDFTHLSRAVAVCLAGWAVVALLALAMWIAFGPSVS